MIEMSSSWETPPLAQFGNGIPHFNFSFHEQSNEFNPYRSSYQEVSFFFFRYIFNQLPVGHFRFRIFISDTIILLFIANESFIIAFACLFILFLCTRLDDNYNQLNKMFSINVLLFHNAFALFNIHYCNNIQENCVKMIKRCRPPRARNRRTVRHSDPIRRPGQKTVSL